MSVCECTQVCESTFVHECVPVRSASWKLFSGLVPTLIFIVILKDLFCFWLCMCLCVCENVHVSAGICGDRKKEL